MGEHCGPQGSGHNERTVVLHLPDQARTTVEQVLPYALPITLGHTQRHPLPAFQEPTCFLVVSEKSFLVSSRL